jgi:hypothetical protein
VSVVLPNTTADVYRPDGTEDAHGWALSALGEGTGLGGVSLQPVALAQHVGADAAGGAGPTNPRTTTAAALYVDPAADVKPGDVILTAADAVPWTVRSVTFSKDPTGDALDCLVAGLER